MSISRYAAWSKAHHSIGRTHLTAVASMGLVLLGLSACSSSTNLTPPSNPLRSTTSSASATPLASSATSSTTAVAPEVNPAGDIPDNQVFVAWSPSPATYTVKVPEGWARTDGASSTKFSDKLNSIVISSVAATGPPTISSETRAVKAIAPTSTGFVLGNVTAITRLAGKTILSLYRADAPADPVTGKVVNDEVQRYTFWKNSQSVTLTLAGPRGADNVDPWRIVTDSFAWSP